MNPAVVLRVDLEAARAAGVDFPTAWTDALEHALANRPESTLAWRAAFDETRGQWRAAYNGEPQCAIEAALAELGEAATT